MSARSENQRIIQLIYFLQLINMKTAKVLKVTIDSWDWQYGKMYSHKLELDNWETIKLNKKKDNQFKVWDTVNYEENGEWKWKEVKEEKTFQPRSTYNPEATNKGAMVWMAMKLAFEQLYDKTNYNEVIQLATRIFEDAMEIYENYGKAENKSDENENDQLPF